MIIFGLEYLPYFKDIKVFFAMVPQGERYCKSIYSALLQIDRGLMVQFRTIIMTSFIYLYVVFCMEFLIKSKNKIQDMFRKYNIVLILAILVLTNFQQWYLVWLFATIMWQKPNMIKNIIGISAITEIANSIYMFKSEHYIYDVFFVGCIICLFMIWQVIANKMKEKKIG